MKITNRTVDALQYTKKGKANTDPKTGRTRKAYPAQYAFDEELKGFGVRVYPSGQKSFVFIYRNQANTKRFLTLGDYPSLKAQQARELAEKHYYNVKQGIDPQAQKSINKEEITFAELAKRYVEHGKAHKKSWAKDEERLRLHILPALGKRKLSEITLAQLQKLQQDLKETLAPATVNRCFALIRHMLNMAVKWGLLAKSPARHVTLFREPPPRDIVLSPEECKRILKACNEEPNQYAAALFKLAMLTGRRVGELINAKWKELDIGRSRLTLPDTKANEQQHVFLNPKAIEVLENLSRIVGNPYIIAGIAPGKALYTYTKAWKRVLARAEIEYFPVHGLRHNFASTLVAANIPLETVGHLLGHKSGLTTRRYSHHHPDHLQKATQRFADIIDLEKERGKKERTKRKK